MKINDLDQKAQFILNFFEEEFIEMDIEEFVKKLSIQDEDFFYWLLDAETPEQREKVDQLSKVEKDVYVIYLQKASKFQKYKKTKTKKI